MPLPGEAEGTRFVLRFGAGVNTTKSEVEIDPTECANGENFALDVDNAIWKRRKPFDLVATATNAEEIRGFAQLIKQDGSLSTLIQAGGTVYEWDGGTTFTSKGTVNSSARLRGHKRQNFTLDEKVLITDLNEAEPVLTWDGTTLATLGHDLGGDFFARYCFVEDESAWFANVKSGSSTPHLILRSKRSDITDLSTADRPTSGKAADDPFFLLSPDLKPINGIVSAFGQLNFSTSRGRIYKITGSTAADYALAELFPDSGAVGDEAIAFSGNDILYGRQGKIESLFSTQTLGDVATDDRTRQIANLIEEVDDWVVVYNARLQKVYCFAPDQSIVYVFHKPFIDERIRAIAQQAPVPELSPWSIWKTDHASGLQPTAAWSMLRPTDKLEQVYFGGSAGQIYMLEGSGGQDGGSENVKSERLSKLFDAPGFGKATEISGYVRYRSLFSATLTLRFEFGGSNLFNETKTIALAANTNFPVFGGSFYFGGSVYFGSAFAGRLTRTPWSVAGQSEQFQVRVTIDGATDFELQEIGFEFIAVKP